MKEDFICPYPIRWNEIYKDLCRNHERTTGQKPDRVDGPPVPLILNGWWFSNGLEKAIRWQEAVGWARKHEALHLTHVEEKDRCYLSDCTRGCATQTGEYSNFTETILRRYKMADYITLHQYLEDQASIGMKLPENGGIYIVIYPHQWPEDLFMETGTGGHFKGKNPNVSLEELWGSWVEGADILYIGKAGGVSRNGKVSAATLKRRIIALLRFGSGKRVGHWGGRYLWQHEDSPDFRIYWHSCIDENPVELEQKLIDEFKFEYSKKPFANLK